MPGGVHSCRLRSAARFSELRRGRREWKERVQLSFLDGEQGLVSEVSLHPFGDGAGSLGIGESPADIIGAERTLVLGKSAK